MASIYKKELLSYLRSMIGYAFIAFVLLISGIYFTAFNLNSMMPEISYTLQAMTFVFLIAVPVLTMRTLAEERRQRTDQLLLTAPVSCLEIVAGKYLALVTLLAIPLTVIGFYPWILSCYGEVSVPEACTALAGFFLMGCAFLAVGVWISSLTENQIIAAVLCFLVLFAGYTEKGIASFFPETAYASFLAVVALIAAAAVWLWRFTETAFAGLVFGAAAESLAALLYMRMPSFYEGRMQKILAVFDLTGPYASFAGGILDLGGVVYDLSVAGWFLFLTVQGMEKRRQGEQPNRNLLRAGMIFLAGAALTGGNLLFARLPSSVTRFDLSTRKLSVLTDQTKEVLKRIEKDYTFYYLVQDYNEDENISRLLENYAEASGHIRLVRKNPLLDPEFTLAYTDDKVSENSVIIECGEKSTVIGYADMYETEFDYYSYTSSVTGFDAEGQITGALTALESGTQAVLYVVNGHGELEMGSTVSGRLEKEKIECRTLGLLTVDAIPADADGLLIHSPSKDLTRAEADLLLEYLKQGGHLIVTVDYVGDPLPNLQSVLEYYGVKTEQGIVMEQDSTRYIQIPYYILPEVNLSEVSARVYEEERYVLLTAAQGLSMDPEVEREHLNAEGILSSSENSFLRTDVEQMASYVKRPEDPSGPFYTGILVSELAGGQPAQETPEEAQGQREETAWTRLAVYGSSSLLDDSADSVVAGGNSELFLDTAVWILGMGEAESVPVKPVEPVSLTVPALDGQLWSGIVIFVIPAATTLCGLTVWIRRRKR